MVAVRHAVGALFSNFAIAATDQAHIVAAPGDCTWSTWIEPANAALVSGTSQASPHAAGTVALCIATAACIGPPNQIIQKIIGDASTYSVASYGFQGDPLTPTAGKYYGYLVRAALY